MTKKTPITDVLREAINSSEWSFRALETQTGVLRQCLMKFSRGETSLMLWQADALAEFFGLELRPAAKPKRSKGAN